MTTDLNNNRHELMLYFHSAKMTRRITDLVVHCSATKPFQGHDVDTIDQWHKARGFKRQPLSGRICGYHFVVLEDGTIQTGRHLNEIGAHVAGSNAKSIGICYIGGIGADGKASDTRTQEQKEAMEWLIVQMTIMFPDIKIKGHRDYSPDLNGDGVIQPWEWMKECPCFNTMDEYGHL